MLSFSSVPKTSGETGRSSAYQGRSTAIAAFPTPISAPTSPHGPSLATAKCLEKIFRRIASFHHVFDSIINFLFLAFKCLFLWLIKLILKLEEPGIAPILEPPQRCGRTCHRGLLGNLKTDRQKRQTQTTPNSTIIFFHDHRSWSKHRRSSSLAAIAWSK